MSNPTECTLAKSCAGLVGRRFVYQDEINAATLHEDNMKRITGGEGMLEVRALREQSQEVPINFKIWTAFNRNFQVGDTSPSMLKRVKMIFFDRQFENQPGFQESLDAECEGFLVMVLEAMVRWKSEGTLAYPKFFQDRTDDYFEDQDPYETFMDTYLEFGEDEFLPNQAIVQAFNFFCTIRGLKNPGSRRDKSSSQKVMGLKLRTMAKHSLGRKKEAHRDKHSQERGWRHLRFSAEAKAELNGLSDHQIESTRLFEFIDS